MQLSPMRADPCDPHAITGFVFSTVDITSSHRSREALIDTGIALSRTLDLERVYAEVAQQVRRAVRGEAFCLALADEETAAFHVLHQFGYEDELREPGPADGVVGAVGPRLDDRHGELSPALAEALTQRLKPVWLDALANECVVLRHGPRGLELTAPVTSAEGVLGAMTVLADDIDSPQRLDEATRLLSTLAAQTAAAIERAGSCGAWSRSAGSRPSARSRRASRTSCATRCSASRPPRSCSASASPTIPSSRRTSAASCARSSGSTAWSPRCWSTAGTAPRCSRRATRRPSGTTCWRASAGASRAAASCSRRSGRARARRAAASTRSSSRRCFLNVLVNAVDAAPEGSDLSLTSSVLPSGAWRCRLHNGGPAIPPEVLAARLRDLLLRRSRAARASGSRSASASWTSTAAPSRSRARPRRATAVVITLPAA